MQKLTGRNQGGDLESEMMFRSAYLIHWGISIVVLEEIYQKISDNMSPSMETEDSKSFKTTGAAGSKKGTFQRDFQLNDHIAMRWANAVIKGEITEDLYHTALGAFTKEALTDLTMTVVLIEGIVKADLYPNVQS
jgi:hypothetical protein